MKADKTQKLSGIIPDHVHHTHILDYAEYQRYIDIIISDVGYNLSFIIGRKGNGKTSAFESILEKYEIPMPDPADEHDDDDEDDENDEELGDESPVPTDQADSDAPIAYLNNAASAVGLYEWFYENRFKKVLILDDVRKVFKDEDAVTLLMQACATKPVKRLFYRKQNKKLEAHGVPTSFTMTTRMVIISNTIDGIVERLEPLLDRGRVFFFDPSVEELHHNWAKRWADPEVWKFIDQNLHECPYPSGRWYYHGSEEKRVNPQGWNKHLLDLWRSTDPERALFLDVQNDPNLKSEGERIEAFKRLGEQRRLPNSRPTYFRWKNDFPHLVRPLPRKSTATSSATAIAKVDRADQVEVEKVESLPAQAKGGPS